jgi:radical SAM protein with 4Fe4S-binding SPASM domain
MAAKTYREWFDDSGRKMMCDDAYDRKTYGQALWDAATKAAEEKFTSTNTGSPKLPAVCDPCPLRFICRGATIYNGLACRGARSQLRADA